MAGPDYTSILTALTGGTDKAIEETNPWSGLESFTNQFGSAITQAAPNYDLQDSLIAGLLTGAIGGLTKNFSNSYKNEQKDYASQAVKDLIEGKALSRDTYQGNPSVFNVLEQSKNAVDLANSQDALERQRALDQQIQLKQTPGYEDLAIGAPNVQDLEVKIRSGQPLTEDDYKLYSTLPVSSKRILQQVETQHAIEGRSKGVQNRFEEGLSVKKGEREIPGFTNVTGNILPLTTVNQIREKVGANEEVKNALYKLKTTGDATSFMALTGNDASAQAALQSSIFNAYRKRTGSGARLEGPEGDMIKAMTPKVLSGDPIGAIKAAMLGRDQQQFADFMIKFLDEDRDMSLFSQGLKANNRPLSFYRADDVQRLGLGDALKAELGASVSSSTPNSLIGPMGASGPSSSNIDRASLEAEAAALKAQGKSAAEIAATLRAKYQGQ